MLSFSLQINQQFARKKDFKLCETKTSGGMVHIERAIRRMTILTILGRIGLKQNSAMEFRKTTTVSEKEEITINIFQ